MKAPRREFVVEYKSTRRQTKAQPKSIWGNLDLGAVARQVDADDVLPVEQPIRSRPVETRQGEQTSSSNAVIDAANVPEDGDDRQPIADVNPEAVDVGLPTDPVPTTNDTQPAGRAAISSQRTRRRKSVARMPSPHFGRSSPAPAALKASMPPVDLGDDIVSLDAENRRLKRLMAEKLRSENDRLRSLLGRLEKIPATDLG